VISAKINVHGRSGTLTARMRRTSSAESHAEWIPRRTAATLKLIAENNKGRQKDLIRLRMDAWLLRVHLPAGFGLRDGGGSVDVTD